MVKTAGHSIVLPLEAVRRAQRIRLLITDVDGVLTDAGVYYSERGELLKRFSVRDGMGVERLRLAGIETGIVSGETSPCVRRRAEKLRLRYVFLGVRDKRAVLPAVLARASVALDELAYMGDDCNDVQLIEEVARHGLAAAPADAMPEVARAVHFRSSLPGGHGAFRDFAEWLLGLRAGANASTELHVRSSRSSRHRNGVRARQNE